MLTYILIDASNLFYGFDTEYGWKIDYARLKKYLEEKYSAICVLYFGGIDTTIGIQPNKEYFHDYSGNETVNLNEYIIHFENLLKTDEQLSISQITLIRKFIQQAKFYRKLESFGYRLFLKPVKRFDKGEFNIPQRKANCDVDLTIEAMANKESFDRVFVLSGDGDFLPLYKYLERRNKVVYVLSRTSKTAREVKRHLGDKFIEIRKLKNQIEFLGNK
jgi:uncharacterized LabA/DUF88 family protein